MNRFIFLAGIVLLAAVVIAPVLQQPAAADARQVAGAKAEHASPWSKQASVPARTASAETVEIERDAQGQFHVEVDVGGETVRFLVDTGADVVALTEDDADRLGIRPDAGDYRPMLQTASGTGMGAPAQIARLTIGGRDLDDVEAVVVPDLPVSLLGQSALRRLGSVTLRGDRLIITG
ncbi:MAG: TIGR02281 family clan AA aspartic protease [Novosphingobium sp.]